MLLPAVALAAFAFALRGRPGVLVKLPGSSSPFVVESVETETLTPYEVSQGYDTKIAVVLDHERPRPKWWAAPLAPGMGIAGTVGKARLLYRNGSQFKLVPGGASVMTTEPAYDKDRDRYIAHYRFYLSHLPVSSVPIVVKDQLAVGMFKSPTRPVLLRAKTEANQAAGARSVKSVISGRQLKRT